MSSIGLCSIWSNLDVFVWTANGEGLGQVVEIVFCLGLGFPVCVGGGDGDSNANRCWCGGSGGRMVVILMVELVIF